MPLRIPTSTGTSPRLSRPADSPEISGHAGVRVVRAESRRPRLSWNEPTYLPSLLTAATFDDWRLAARAGLPLPDSRLRFEVVPGRAVIVGHAGRCEIELALDSPSMPALLNGSYDKVPGTYELSLCARCRPAVLAWYLEVSGLAVRAHAVATPVRTRSAAATVEWERVPILVAALGTPQHPAPAVRSAYEALGSPPQQATEVLAREVRSWVQYALSQAHAAVEAARERLYDDAWMTKTLKMAGLDPDVDPVGAEVWVLCDVSRVLGTARSGDHKLLSAALLHRTRFPTAAVSPDGRWWALRLPAHWTRALPSNDAVRTAGAALPLVDDPILIGEALRLWRDACAGALDEILTEPAAALATARRLRG